jgi:cell division protein FtsW
MILSVSRYTAKLDEEKEKNNQIQMEIVAPDEEAAEPTSQMLNSDAEFEE